MFYYSDDPGHDFDLYDSDLQAELDRLPKCCCCDNEIQDEYYYEINGEIVCEECLNEKHRKSVESYLSDDTLYGSDDD